MPVTVVVVLAAPLPDEERGGYRHPVLQPLGDSVRADDGRHAARGQHRAHQDAHCDFRQRPDGWGTEISTVATGRARSLCRPLGRQAASRRDTPRNAQDVC
jgi:hypothetical protein